MNLRNEKGRHEQADPSRRARLDDLLFNGAKLATTVQPATVIPGTKYPRDAGE
ncbi:MAG TPA: hypothetical protein VN851_15505 [Thermoanaerobaculia bacterium]|nr:hypothetical protein [Thermoanaerobaculia bacterium]